MQRAIGPARGFSLIEVLIAIAVLAVGLLAMARFQGAALQASSLAKERSEAVALAEQKIEQLRNFTNFANIGPCVTDTLTILGAVTTNAATVYYTRTCSLGAMVPAAGAGVLYQYRNVSVRVTWARPGASAADTGVTLTTTINNSELRYSGQLS